MYQLKGFFNFAPLIDNTLDQVALFGEISSDSLTFAKDKTYHTNEAAPQTTLIAFDSKVDGSYAPVPVPVAEMALVVGQFLLDRTMSGTLSSDPNLFRNNLQAEFSTAISDITSGELLENDGLRLPEWIRFSVVDHPEDNEITVWLSDESFQFQYTGFTIDVIPPVVPLDDFFNDPLAVQALLNDYDLVEKINEVQVTRGDYPYTQLLARRYNYTNPMDDGFQVPSYWLVIIYGQAGVNPDVIRNAIIDYILANSTHTREEWTPVLPDLFLTTEFIITPFWTSYAVPNRELQAGIYSPTVRPQDALATLLQTTIGPMYTTEWITQNYELSNLLYKSLAFGVVGNPQNRDGITSFQEKFSEYILVTNNSADFNRMSVWTQEFYVLLGEMTRIAEDLTEVADVPVGMSRLERNGVEYVAAIYDNVTYLMVGKPYLEELMGV